MFSRISGALGERAAELTRIESAGLVYDVIVPPSIADKVPDEPGSPVTLEVFAHFALDGNAGKFTFFGFSNAIEREFFEALLSVASIGPKSAARAFSAPMSRIARAIDEGDHAFLKTLPGSGQQKARDIVAKLQGKVARFLLIQDAPPRHESPRAPMPAFAGAALAVLLQLAYKRTEAEAMIARALESAPRCRSRGSLKGRSSTAGNFYKFPYLPRFPVPRSLKSDPNSIDGPRSHRSWSMRARVLGSASAFYAQDPLFPPLALAAFTQCIDVNQILCSTCRKFCNQQVLSRDKWYGQIIIYSNIHSPSPCFFKFDTANFRHDVYHHRWRAHAKDVIGLGEVVGTHSFNRCSELRERGIYGFAVFSVCADQNIKIFCRTRLRMKRNRVSTNNQVSNLPGVESG